ncbi:MAG: hypothetical protein AABZ94_08745 [Candidatus Eisenbacteria bacterium]
MRTLLLSILMLGATAWFPPRSLASSPPAADVDRESAGIVRAMTDAMGGQETWDRLPYFRFDFVVVRDGKEVARFRHWWDKRNGRCRVEGPDDQGKQVAAIFTLADRKGSAFVEGIGESDAARVATIVQNGYERWVNDTYWIMMPFKLSDPGVRIRYARNERTLETVYDVLELSFVAGTGLTSDDRYWLYVNRRTHLIDRWDYVLTGQKPPPSGASWEAWTGIGPVKLSLQRRFQGKPVMLRFENVAAPAAFDERVFTFSTVRN